MVSGDTISNNMTALVLGLIGLFASIVTAGIAGNNARVRQEKQMAHDKEMAEIQKQNELDIAHQTFDMQNSFNNFANNRSQMVSAGFNPALMFGGLSSPVTSSPSGSASASSSNIGDSFDPSKAFEKFDPFEVGDLEVANRQADMLQGKIEHENFLNDARASLAQQQALESMSRTNSNTYDLGFKKANEKVIEDTMHANLVNIRANANNLQSQTEERDIMLSLRSEYMQKQIRLTTLEIQREPLVRSQINADINEINSLASLHREMASTEGKKREELQGRINSMENELQSSTTARIMRECGLYQKQFRPHSHGTALKDFTPQEVAAYNALIDADYSPSRAATIVLYYSGVEPKDITPSLINGASRVLGGVINGVSSVATAKVPRVRISN